MRASRQLRATVKSATRYLEANTPTGLTGLPTHPSPRPALLYTYNETLQKLKQLPQSSVYRQSAEALTKHRLSIVESAKPDGYDEWLVRVKKQIESDPASYGKLARDDGSVSHEYLDETPRIAWDGTVTRRDAKKEGSNTQTEAEQKAAMVRADVEKTDREAEEGTLKKGADLEVEPALTANQISDMETKLAAGLIEEVVQVAEGELVLVEEMLASRAWEDLEEKAPSGQWEYFDRGDRV